MSNKGKKKCASCGCFEDWKFVEEDGKKKKYYCCDVCFRNGHPDNSIWCNQKCETCGENMYYANSPMFFYDYIDDKMLFFCCESCFGYYFGTLNKEHRSVNEIEERISNYLKYQEG